MMMLRTSRVAKTLFHSVRFPTPCSVRSFSTRYSESHEWIKVEGNTATVGITDFAQNSLGDVVYVELPEVGEEFEASEAFGSVESVKAASDLYVPVSGKIVEVNNNLEDSPGLVNESPTEDGWFVKISITDAAELDSLLDEDAYQELIKAEENH